MRESNEGLPPSPAYAIAASGVRVNYPQLQRAHVSGAHQPLPENAQSTAQLSCLHREPCDDYRDSVDREELVGKEVLLGNLHAELLNEKRK
jgi:hypothetical protein